MDHILEDEDGLCYLGLPCVPILMLHLFSCSHIEEVISEDLDITQVYRKLDAVLESNLQVNC